MNNKNILAIIPARSGSKGVKDKNIKLLNGIELLGHAGILCSGCDFIDNKVISTDSLKYQKIANKFDIDSPFIRPENIAGDFIGDIDVLSHALLESEKFYNKRFEIIYMLQPTAPFRNVKVLKSCLTKLIEENLDSVWTISEVNNKYNPLKQLKISEEKIKLFDNRGTKIIARQQLEKTYIRNGQCYCFTRKSILEYKTIFPEKNGYLITPSYPNIDTTEDFKLAEYQFNNFINE